MSIDNDNEEACDIIIIRLFYAMIYAYCLSIYSINFFSKPDISKFKLRLINQQTADCTDSPILDAKALSNHDFPVQIKLKGGERLLMKVKLISIPAKTTETMIGEGVVSFDKNSIDNSLRVPIYDKKKGIEQIAICSIDFFLSGFTLDKNTPNNADKSRSRIEDWRDREEDAVYSQMSYTIQSENDSSSLKEPSRRAANQKPNRMSDPQKQKETAMQEPRTRQLEGQNLKINIINQSRTKQNEEKVDVLQIGKLELQQASEEQPAILQPVPIRSFLQNNAYIKNSPNLRMPARKIDLLSNEGTANPSRFDNRGIMKRPIQSKMQSAKRHSPQQESNPSKNGLSSNDQQYSKKETESINQDLYQKVKQNEKMINKLRHYIEEHQKGQQKQRQSERYIGHKIRRKYLKVQEKASYKYQNKFIKYHLPFQTRPAKILKNIKAIKMSQYQHNEETVEESINQIHVAYLDGEKILSFDSLGYVSYCLANHIKETMPELRIPGDEGPLRLTLGLADGSEYEGVMGLQEGSSMAIILTTSNKKASSSQVKVIFDIGHENAKGAKLQERQKDHSFRESLALEYAMPQHDLRKRVESLSMQPWGYTSDLAENGKMSTQKPNKFSIGQTIKQLPQPLINTHTPKMIGEPKITKIIKQTKNSLSAKKEHKYLKEKEKTYKKVSNMQTKRFYTSDEHENDESSLDVTSTKQFVENSPLSKKNRMPLELPHQMTQITEINNIRNGNRNNYKYQQKQQEKEQQKIKRLWQQLLTRKQAELDKSQINKYRLDVEKAVSTNKRKANHMLDESLSSNYSSKSKVSPISVAKARKVYQMQPQQMQDTFPLRTLTLEIKNISITQPQVIVDEDRSGKFVKFSVKNKISYFTEIIFNEDYNSILWKLDGCIFGQLTGSERLEIQIFETLDNKIKTIGQSQIRLNKLHFLRNNHIYNGKIVYNYSLHGEYTVGFQITEHFPFEVIEEEDETVNKPKLKDYANGKLPVETNLSSKILPTSNQKRIKTVSNQKRELLSPKLNFDDSADGNFGHTLKKDLGKHRRQDSKHFDSSSSVTYKKDDLELSMTMPKGILLQRQ